MRTPKHRRPPLPDSFRAKKQHGVCRWCAGAVTGRGRYWHPKCIETYLIATSSQAQRAAVFKRDKGVCAGCGIDAHRHWRRHLWQSLVLRWSPETQWRKYWHHPAREEKTAWLDKRWRRYEMRLRRALEGRQNVASKAGWRAHDRAEGAWWQADHIRPLIEANGNPEFWLLANIQTLCHRCHAAKSAADRKKRKTLCTAA